ncbi:acyltransferase [Rhizobium sp. MHM7A]|uniref:acyltransferase family protein n=1 Tax=Rhizobium sp. MHM7A TaxID=2583233 RepID=UPI00110670A5|nr:acyltransferase [Rhizobium sp. MHM7A]TLX16787.1 acyltransferase [Rhizobium sp. MHM7A]
MSVIPSRIADIQVLRGIAVSAVFIQHYASWFPLRVADSSMKLNFLWIGVDLFFVISGFLIVSKLLTYERDAPLTVFKSFWLARFRRLLPAAAFWAVVGLLVSLGLTWLENASITQVGSTSLASLTGVSNLYWSACAHGYLSESVCAGKGPFAVYWSLSLEEQFYLLASACLLLGYRKCFLTLLVVACAWNLSTAWTSPWSLGWVLRPYGLAVGSGLAFIFWKWPGLSSKVMAVPDRVALAAILVCLIIFMGIFYTPVTTLLACLFCGVLVWLAAMDGCFSKTPVGRWVEYLGERSYSFYLSHVIVILVVRDIVMRFTGTKDMETLPQSWLVFAATFGVTLIVSDLSYRHIENRFRLRGKGSQPGRPLLAVR